MMVITIVFFKTLSNNGNVFIIGIIVAIIHNVKWFEIEVNFLKCNISSNKIDEHVGDFQSLHTD